MKKTLLELTQLILSSMDSDEIDSITDTTEAQQVVDIIESTYWHIASTANLPEHFQFYALTETSASTPVLMTLPSTSIDLAWVKYNWATAEDTEQNFQEIIFKNLDDFLRDQEALDSTEDTTDTMSFTAGSSSFVIKFRNDRGPRYFTTPDDYNLLFDSYDSGVETYLRAAKTMAYGQTIPTFTRSDSFTPDLDPKQFTLLFNESKSQAFADLKQVQNAKAEQRARKAWVHLQPSKRAITTPRRELDRAPNYSRKG